MKNKFNFKSIILTLTLLTLGVGQMWADWYVQGSGTGLGGWGQGAKMTQNPASTSIYYRRVSGTCEFKVTSQEDGYSGEKGSGAINNSHAGANVTLTNSNGNIKSTQSGTWYICYDSSTEKVYAQTSLPAPAPTAVVSGTSFMFYIKSYDNWKHAVTPNSTSSRVDGTYAGGDATSWVTVTNAQKSTYTYITNNRTGWGGKQNSNISSTTGGQLYQANDNVTTTAAKTASTTTSVSGDVLSISTTTDATSGVYGSLSLYIQYYIDGDFVGVTYSSSTASYGSITAGGATARASTFDVSGLTNGSHTLKTVLTDGNIFWVADTDNFNVAHTYTITYKDQDNVAYSGSNSASLPSSYTYGVGVSLVPGEKAGYSFGGWYTATDCSSGLTTSISTSATGNKIFYAKWTLEPGVTLSAASATLNIGQTVRLTATGSNASNITKYDFYEGSTKIKTVSTSATSATYDYTPTTTGSKTMKVIMTYNSGSSTIESSTVGLSINTPSVATLTEASSTTEMWIGENPTGALTFSATSSNVGSGASVTWSISDASSGTFTQTGAGSYSGKSWTYTPASTGDKTITVTMTVGGNNYTKTYNLTVYERWNIYVHNNCKWAGGVALYMWNDGGSNAPWPGVTGTGTGCEIYNGNWYVVTLDSKYTSFLLDNNQASSGIEQCYDVTMSKVTHAPGTFWEFIYSKDQDSKKYYTLTAASLSDPTVVLDASEPTSIVINTNQIFLTGHITNYGGDGSAAADMIEVGFELNGTKYPMTCKEGDDTRFFWGYVTGLTAGTTYTVKAYATNIHGTGKSSGTSFTTRAAGTTTIKVRSAVGRTAPYIYAYTETDAGCNGTTTYNAAAPGVAMTKVITGTVYNWYEYDISNEFNKFRISENGSNKTDDWESPAEATCYYYHPTEATQGNRLGTMACPSAIPQLMINGGGSSEVYTYYDMSSGGVNEITKTLTLSAKTGYLFKPVYNAEWYGKASTNITRAANSVTGLDAAVEDNLYMTTDAAGPYTFTFNTSTKALTITYPTAYTITYGAGTINGSNSAISVSPSFDSEDYVLAETDVTVSKGTTKTGYTWKGWYSNAGGTGEAWSTTDANLSLTATRTGNINVYACYTYTNYTITYNLNGGSNPVSPAPATSYTIASSTITLPTPTRTGYTFGGWKINSELSGDSYTTIPSGSTGNKVYYAKWTANNYTVTLHEQGATTSGTPGDGGTITMTYDATNNIKDGEGAAIQIITTLPIKTGHVFGGYWNSAACNDKQLINATGYYNWNVSGYIDGTTNTWVYADNVDLYAKWTPKQSALTFDYQASAEGYGASGSISAVSATYGAAMPALSGSMPTAANGYAFMGFFSETGGNGTKYYNADKSSAHNWDVDTESATTLYAYYKKAEITTITLNATMFEPVGAGDVGYVVANPTIAPTPTGTTATCWELLYDNDNPVLGHPVIADPEEGKPNQVKFSIAGLAAGGYKIRATLHTEDGACGTGTTLSVQEASFTIASAYVVTIQYKCGSDLIQASTTSPGKPLQWTEITAPDDIFGYTFSKWKAGEGITIEDADANGEKASATINYKASFNGILTAIYTKKSIFYFKNTLGWEEVYVNFMSNQYWDGYKGSGNKNNYYSRNNAMSLVPGTTDIYYIEYTGSTSQYITFTSKSQDNAENFWGKDPNVQVVVPTRPNDNGSPQTDFGYYAGTNMFIPLNVKVQTKNTGGGGGADYYNRGYWVVYDPITGKTGYTLEIYNKTDDSSRDTVKVMPFTFNAEGVLEATVDLEAATNYGIKFRRDNGMRYTKNGGTLTNDAEQKFEYHPNNWAACAIKTTAAGDYVFTINCSSSDGFLYLKAHFPAAVGDFQVYYKDNSKPAHPSRMITARASGVDTISFFVDKTKSPMLKARKVNSIDGGEGTITWGALNISGEASQSLSVDSTAVYNFVITQSTAGTIASIENIGAYKGDYYIRCAALNSKWDFYRSDRDHLMTYSSFSESDANAFGEKFSHYKTKWCKYGKNVKFCIANDYSPCISDTLIQDVGNPYDNINGDGFLKDDGNTEETENIYSANIRFMWNRKTNKVSRAYVASSTNTERLFLVLRGNNTIEGEDEQAISEQGITNGVVLQDKENWMYEEVLYILPGTRFKLFACYAEATPTQEHAQYFRGNWETGDAFISDGNSVVLIGGSGTKQKARIIYDFKTNRLMAAWIPSGADVSGDMQINADVLVEREHQEPAQYITFANASSQLSGVKTVYGAMKFNRWILNNRQNSSDDDPNHGKTAEQIATHHAPLPVGQQKSIYERSLYFISFPFDVNASDIFGFGHYWDEWYLEYYDGLNRAKNGYWEDSPPNWKYVTPSMLNDFVLKANEGYILGLDLDFMKADNFDFWSNGISTVELFFPSTASAGTLQQTNCTIPALSAIEGDPYRCTINRGTTEGDRRVKDSYWRCLGVPSFNIYSTSLTDGSGNPITWQPSGNTLPFIYAWNKADNTLTAQSASTFTFLPMHAYLVQNGGEIRWTNVSAKPASPIVARRVNEQPEKKYEWRLALMSDSILIDQTYIKMSNLEQVTDSFDFNQDLIKEFNTYRSDIYTYIGNERVAANSMPLQTEQTTVIPVGVKIKTAGEYTFAMPDGTNGVGVTLIDTETGVRTSLGLMDYTVTLTAGSFNQRFFLEISPVSNVATDIERLDNGDWTLDNVRKVLIDNKLFIITEDGKVFDARGAMVK